MNKKLMQEAKALPALLQVGKNGITDAFKTELVKTIEKKKLVKIKLLRSFVEAHKTKTVAQELSQELKLELVVVSGNTIVFSKNS